MITYLDQVVSYLLAYPTVIIAKLVISFLCQRYSANKHFHPKSSEHHSHFDDWLVFYQMIVQSAACFIRRCQHNCNLNQELIEIVAVTVERSIKVIITAVAVDINNHMVAN